MSDDNDELKRDLERLRLASDLTQLATDTLNPYLRAHCLRMAGVWSDQVNQGPNEDIVPPNFSIH